MSRSKLSRLEYCILDAMKHQTEISIPDIASNVSEFDEAKVRPHVYRMATWEDTLIKSVSRGVYSLTSNGILALKGELPEPSKETKKRGKQKPKEVVAKPVQLDLSASATQAVDYIGNLVSENAKLRTALLEINSTINELLGNDDG